MKIRKLVESTQFDNSGLERLNSSHNDRFKKASLMYRKKACIGEDTPITEETINKEALNLAAHVYAYGPERLRKELITESYLAEKRIRRTDDDMAREAGVDSEIYRQWKRAGRPGTVQDYAKNGGQSNQQTSPQPKQSSVKDQPEIIDEPGDNAQDIEDKIEASQPDIPEDQAEDMAKDVAEVKQKAQAEVVYVEGDMERKLNGIAKMALRKHKRGQGEGYPTLCIIGDVGLGKTSRVKSWCKGNPIIPGVRLVKYSAEELSIDKIEDIPLGEDPDRKGRVKTGSLGFFDPLDRNDPCVLYIDEYNRTQGDKRRFWFTLIDEHVISDPSDPVTRTKFLPNLLFSVITINPYYIPDPDNPGQLMTDDDEGTTPLSKAESNRVIRHTLVNDNLQSLNYYTKFYEKEMKEFPEEAEETQGRLNLATKLLRDPNFFFSSTEEINKAHKEQDSAFLTPRSFKSLLDICDGTKGDFLEQAPGIIGTEKTQMCADILSNYRDSDDVSNDVFNDVDGLVDDDDVFYGTDLGAALRNSGYNG